MRNFGKLVYSKSRRSARSVKSASKSFLNTRLGIGIVLSAIIGSIVLLVILFMQEDGDRSKCDPVLDDPGRRPQVVDEGSDAFHPIIPTPTPLPGTFLKR